MSTPYSINTNGFLPNDIENVLSLTGENTSTKRSNALSNRLTSVLSTSFADSETRDALRLLDSRDAQNADETRLNLKLDTEQEVIAANARIVDDFGKVATQLKRVGALITILNQTCDDMRSHIQSSKQETAPMLEEASTLLARKHETETKQQLLNAFNAHFIISDDDLTTLTSSAEPVNEQYFTVLSRVKQIHKDCEILLGYENQRLGLELMEQTTRNLDAGYKKLYNWIQREFKGLDLEDPSISGSIRRSLRALSERPTLFQNCLDFFGEARQATLSEAFQKALTDSTLGSSKAIEFSTHDPLRYIGDMLAWVHSTTVSEKEALEGLFISDADEINRGLRAGKSSEPWARLRRTSSIAGGDKMIEDDAEDDSTESTFDGHTALNSLISRNMASVSQILNQRISLTMRNLTDQITIYKSYNLLLFYQDIFVKLLGITNLNAQEPQQSQAKTGHQSQNSLLAALSTLQTQTLAHFQTTVAEDIEGHSSSTDSGPTLQPPGILQSNLALFSNILNLRAPSLTSAEFAKLYGTLLGPVLELCGKAATSLSPQTDGDESQDGESFEALVYRLNYMHAIISVLTALAKDTMLSPLISAPLQSAEREVEKLADELADNVTAGFLQTSGVQEVLEHLKSLSGKPLEEKRKILLTELEDASATLDSFLASVLMDVQEQLAKLNDKAAAKSIVADAVETFCEEFEKVVDTLDEIDVDHEEGRARPTVDEKDGDAKEMEEDDLLLREVYPRTVVEVRALVS